MMTPPPRISIVTPNLNHGEFIERAICSVLDQGYENLEHIVVDGGSTDDSVEIVQLYEEDSVRAIAALCRTRGDAINHGLRRATGQIIGVLNSNDVYLPGTLQAVAERMAATDSPAWVVGQAVRIDSFDQEIGTVAARQPTSLSSYLMRDSGLIPTGASFWRADHVAAPAAFNNALLFAADYEHACRLMAAQIMPTIVSEAFVAIRDRTESQSAVATLLRGLEHITVAKCYSAHLPIGERYALWRNLDQRQRIYTLAQAELLPPTARRFLWRELVSHPWWLADETMRHVLMYGIEHPAQLRPAA